MVVSWKGIRLNTGTHAKGCHRSRLTLKAVPPMEGGWGGDKGPRDCFRDVAEQLQENRTQTSASGDE